MSLFFIQHSLRPWDDRLFFLLLQKKFFFLLQITAISVLGNWCKQIQKPLLIIIHWQAKKRKKKPPGIFESAKSARAKEREERTLATREGMDR
jgi:hypothetical protein